MNILLNEIHPGNRVRHDIGDIKELAASIATVGMLNPITVMQTQEGYNLIAGYRRLCAAQMLGWESIPANIMTPADEEEHLRMLIAENECRKDFNQMERALYVDTLIGIRERRKRQETAGTKPDRATPKEKSARSHEDKAEMASIAQKAGYKSLGQLEHARFVFLNAPELLGEVDLGNMTLSHAYNMARGIEKTKVQSAPKAKKEPHNDGFEAVLHNLEEAAQAYLVAIQQAVTAYLSGARSKGCEKTLRSSISDTFKAATIIMSRGLGNVASQE